MTFFYVTDIVDNIVTCKLLVNDKQIIIKICACFLNLEKVVDWNWVSRLEDEIFT